MPTLLNKRGKKRYQATPWHKGRRGKTKLMPDASKKSYRAAIAWEQKEIEQLKAEMEQTAMDCLTVLHWSDEYLDYVEKEYVKKTYQEKKSAFERLVAMEQIVASTPVADIDRYVAAALFKSQVGTRSGHAINKDRKNLGAAWTWGKDHLKGFPIGENPFLAIPKRKEQRQPRYVPPASDFWTVYNYVAALAEKTGEDRHLQDRIMLLAYLHLAARRSELFRAKWSDVDFNNQQIRLGTRKRDDGLEFDWLPLTDELQADLLMWAEKRLAHSTMDKEHIFVCLSPLPCCDQHYGLPFKLRRWAMAKWCDKAQDEPKIKPFGFHAIRHLSASELYRKGCPTAHIQAVLRHRSPTTTNIYLRTLGPGQELRETLNTGLSSGKVVAFSPNKKASSGQA